MYDLMFGGYGARAGHDGAEALSPVVNCANIPVEVHETINPVLVRRFELMPDTGGAGRWRGGCGIRKDIELRADRAVMTLLGERHSHTGYGLFGGEPGSLAETVLNPDGEASALGSKDVRPLKQGDVVSFRLNGGGGYGQPARARPAGGRRGRGRWLRLARGRAAHLRLARLILALGARGSAQFAKRDQPPAPFIRTARAARRRDCATACAGRPLGQLGVVAQHARQAIEGDPAGETRDLISTVSAGPSNPAISSWPI